VEGQIRYFTPLEEQNGGQGRKSSQGVVRIRTLLSLGEKTEEGERGRIVTCRVGVSEGENMRVKQGFLSGVWG